MKTIKSLLLVVAVTFSSVLFANTNPVPNSGNDTKKTISTELSALLQKPDINLDKAIETKVKIMLNENNEVVVISIDCEDVEVKNYIKNRLNYKQLKSVDSKNRVYVLPLKINAG